MRTSAARAPTTTSSAGPGTTWGPLFEQLAANVAEAPPLRPKPLTQDGLLGLFKSEVVGRNVVLEPASHEDMCGGSRRREDLARDRVRHRLMP